MPPTTHTITHKHTLNLNSLLFRPRSPHHTTPLLSLAKHHTFPPSNPSRKETLRQIRAKAWYEHLYTKFHTINNHTCPTFKILLADLARRAGHTVDENDDEVAGSRCGCPGNETMILKGEDVQRRQVEKWAGDSVNGDDGDDGVRERRRDWFEEEEEDEEDEDEGAGDDAKGTDNEDEDITENRLDRYLDAVERDANAVLERVRVLKGEAVNKHEANHAESFNEAFLEGMRVVKVEKKKGDGDGFEENYKGIRIESIWWDGH